MNDAPKPRFLLFTDGACSGNPGPGGWAYIVRPQSEHGSPDDPYNSAEYEDFGGEPRTTNNRMELLAAINGLESLKQPSIVTLFSDSQYVTKGLSEWLDGWIRKGWKRAKNQPVLNQELWQRLDELRKIHDIETVWVKGHSDHPENNRCDELAVRAAQLEAESNPPSRGTSTEDLIG